MIKNIKCKNCGGDKLTWHSHARNAGGAVDGRIRMSEVSIEFYLGCDECYETIKVISDGNMLELFNNLAAENAALKAATEEAVKLCGLRLLSNNIETRWASEFSGWEPTTDYPALTRYFERNGGAS